jgi:hypothetical protein
MQYLPDKMVLPPQLPNKDREGIEVLDDKAGQDIKGVFSNSLLSQMRKQRHKLMKWFAQDLTASEEQNWSYT